MVLFETHQRFKGHFFKELRVSFDLGWKWLTPIVFTVSVIQLQPTKLLLMDFDVPNRYQKYYNKIKTMSIDLLSYSSLRTAL